MGGFVSVSTYWVEPEDASNSTHSTVRLQCTGRGSCVNPCARVLTRASSLRLKRHQIDIIRTKHVRLRQPPAQNAKKRMLLHTSPFPPLSAISSS